MVKKNNVSEAAPVDGLERYRPENMSLGGMMPDPDGGYVTRSQAEAIIAAERSRADKAEADAKKYRLPDGHTVLEQADMLDGTGRVSQTVRVEATGEEYERIVHADEAYGEDE